MISFKEYLEEKKKNPCWTGYKKVPGKADYEEDSCVKEDAKVGDPAPQHYRDQLAKDAAKYRKKKSVAEETELDEAATADAKGHKSATGGLTQKGRDAYNREHGSNLKAPVTTPPSKLKAGSKAANRRKSFCARMSGVDGPMKKPNGEPTRKALALRKWNC
jgi:hypothetical protein